MNTRNQTIALIALSLLALACIVGGIILSADDKSVPEFLVATGGVSVGAIAGIVTGQAKDA